MKSAFDSSQTKHLATSDTAELRLGVFRGIGGLEKLVLIKQLLPRVQSDEAFFRSFAYAARRAALLNHPHIAQIYDVHSDEANTHIVSEYVSGEDLGFIMRQAATKQQRMPVPIACRIIAQAAAGVFCAHNATGPDGKPSNLVHGGLSPSNVLVHYAGVAKVTDFGLSSASDPNDRYVNPSGRLIKLAYRSPEQILGQAVDQRTDVYALGVLLYELLAGRPLFLDGTPDVRDLVLQLNVPPPSKFNEAVTSELDELVLSAIERDVAKRCPTAQQFQEQLEERLAKQGVVASEYEVNAWMVDIFKTLHDERLQLERSVVAGSRTQQIESDLGVALKGEPGQTPPHFFSEIPTVETLSAPSASFGRDMSVQPPNASRRHGTPLLPFLLGTLAVLIVAAGTLTAILFYNHQRRQSEPYAVGEASPASLVVHVSPEDSLVVVNGQTISDAVGKDGVQVPVPPSSEVAVVVSKSEFNTDQRTVYAPETGPRHVYVTLSKADGKAPSGAKADRTGDRAQNGPDAPRAEEEDPARKRRTPSVVKPRATMARRRRARLASRRARSHLTETAPHETATTTLSIVYAPPNATVSIDGAPRRGSSPLRIDGLDPGTHTIEVSAPGFVSRTTEVELTSGGEVTTSRISLVPRVMEAPVTIVSKPPGARLTIDGKPHGKTPTTGLRLKVGSRHRFKLSMEGFKHWETVLEIRADAPNRVEADLKKAPSDLPSNSQVAVAPKQQFGNLLVASPNADGDVWINGRKRGKAPMIVKKVPAGEVLVEIKVGNHVRRSRRVILPPNKGLKLILQ